MTPERWQRLRRALEAALATDTPGDRESVLVAACAGDPTLLAEVRSILLAASDTRGFLQAPPTLTGGDGVGAGEDQPSLLGRTLGHYRIEERLGAGGMGEVFRARDLALGRQSAVKVLPRRVRPDLRERLVREAEAAARLQHPAIATFFEAGQDGEETYIAMEFVRGETLRARLRRGPLTAEESLALTSCLLGALSHAHAAGLLHRDIKPENVMITGLRSAKLLDFGLACALAAVAEPSAGGDLTAQTAVLGTAGYMSPEQVVGERLDARSDVFQVGIVLYESLTGRAAFPGPSPYHRLAAAVACEVDFRAVLDGGDPGHGLTRILARALARDREQRYPSAMAFLRDLGALQQRRPAAQPLLAFAVPPSDVEAALDSSDAVSTPLEVRGPRDARIADLMTRAGRLVTQFGRDALEEAIHLLEEVLALQPDHAAAHAALARAHDFHAIATTDAAELAQAIDHADRAIALEPDNGQGHLWKGYAQWRQGRWHLAAPTLRRAVELAPRDGHASYFMGVASFLEGAKEEALPYLERSVELEPLNAMSWLALGCDHLMLLNLAAAQHALARCLALERNPSAIFGTAGAAAFLGEALRMEGRLQEARPCALEGIEAAEASDHPYRDTFRAYGLCVLGRTTLEQRDLEGARAAYNQVIAQLSGRKRPRSCGHLMVQALAGLGRAGDSEAFTKALELFEVQHTWNFENFHGCLPEIDLLELARAAHAVGRGPEAASLLARAREAGAREPLEPSRSQVPAGAGGMGLANPSLLPGQADPAGTPCSRRGPSRRRARRPRRSR